MSRKARPNPKPKRQATFIRQWRTHGPYAQSKKITLAQLSERLENLHEILIDSSQLSRIERGEQPYSQDLLEAIAHVLGAPDAASLLMRDPSDEDAPWSLEDRVRTMAKEDRAKVAAYVEGLLSSRTA